MRYPPLTHDLADCWCGHMSDHFGLATEQQSHLAHTSFILTCAIEVRSAPGEILTCCYCVTLQFYAHYLMNYFPCFLLSVWDKCPIRVLSRKSWSLQLPIPRPCTKKLVGCSKWMLMLSPHPKPVQQMSFKKNSHMTWNPTNIGPSGVHQSLQRRTLVTVAQAIAERH